MSVERGTWLCHGLPKLMSACLFVFFFGHDECMFVRSMFQQVS